MISRFKMFLPLGLSLALASGAGFLVSQAIGASSQTPPKTVTINVATGPQGPPGPTGPSGTSTCPTGFSAGELVINHPGGQTLVWTCIGN
jgi:hypothetical protein